MDKLIKTTRLVKTILEEVPHTRDSDTHLIYEYYKRRGVNIDRPFNLLLLEGDLYDIESVTRVRRRLQRLFPELKGVEAEERRKINREQYEKFATQTTREMFE